jgi:hypothetical protein
MANAKELLEAVTVFRDSLNAEKSNVGPTVIERLRDVVNAIVEYLEATKSVDSGTSKAKAKAGESR